MLLLRRATLTSGVLIGFISICLLGAASCSSVSYPRTVYPASITPAQTSGVVKACPNPMGLQTPGARSRIEAVDIITHLGNVSLAYDLQHTDQTLWPEDRAVWRTAHKVGPAGPVLYAGPLTAASDNFGVPIPSRWLYTGCGTVTVQASYLLVTGTQSRPALQAASVFVQRSGHLLLYFAD